MSQPARVLAGAQGCGSDASLLRCLRPGRSGFSRPYPPLTQVHLMPTDLSLMSSSVGGPTILRRAHRDGSGPPGIRSDARTESPQRRTQDATRALASLVVREKSEYRDGVMARGGDVTAAKVCSGAERMARNRARHPRLSVVVHYGEGAGTTSGAVCHTDTTGIRRCPGSFRDRRGRHRGRTRTGPRGRSLASWRVR